jgi:CRISPR-associated protein Cas1
VSDGGILVVGGFGCKLSVKHGHLFVSDGVCESRRAGYLSRATSSLKHVIILGHSGSITLDSFRWLHALGAGVSMIGADGEVLFTSSSLSVDEASLRRSQALAAYSPVGFEAMRSLLMAKVSGQARNLRQLGHDAIADHLGAVVDTLEGTTAFDELMPLEGYAADHYWRAVEGLAVSFARKDQARVPEHWRRFGPRQGQAGSSPRNAKTPANSALNLLYGLLETEARNACLKLGLDPGVGLLHTDKRDRDSLALDLMEAIRPDVDRWLFDVLAQRTFSRSEFAELETGVVRLSTKLAQEFCRTAPLWRAKIAPVAERVAQQIVTITRPDATLPTRLTHANRTSAVRARKLASDTARVPVGLIPNAAPTSPVPPKEITIARPTADTISRVCRECGKPISSGSRGKFCSSECRDAYNREVFLVAAVAAAQSPEAKQKRAESTTAQDRNTGVGAS